MNARPHIAIRPARPDDAQGIVRVQTQGWLSAYPDPSRGVTEADIRARLAQRTEAEKIERTRNHIASDPTTLTWVATDGPKIVGMCVAAKGEDRNKLGALYILSEYRRQGIGSALLQPALDWLGPDKDIWLSVVEYNQPAIGIYEKFGFVQTGPFQDEITLPSGAVLPQIEMIKKAQS